MDDYAVIDQLEELAQRFGVQIRYEPIKQDEDLAKVVGGHIKNIFKPHLSLNPKDQLKISK